MGIELLKVKLSGGASNADVSLSIGGVKSSVAVLSQAVAPVTPISGITVADAAGNPLGNGTLKYYYQGKTASWTPPTGAEGVPVSIGANGTYLLRGANTTDGYVIVTVVSASLSNAYNFTTLAAVTNQVGLFLPAVDKDTAFAGATQYYCYYLENAGASTIKSVQAQIQVDTPGVDTLSLGRITTINTQGTNDGDANTGHGVTFNAVGVNAVLGDIPTTEYWGIWIKRVIPAATVDGVTANTFKLLITSLS